MPINNTLLAYINDYAGRPLDKVNMSALDDFLGARKCTSLLMGANDARAPIDLAKKPIVGAHVAHVGKRVVAIAVSERRWP